MVAAAQAYQAEMPGMKHFRCNLFSSETLTSSLNHRCQCTSHTGGPVNRMRILSTPPGPRRAFLTQTLIRPREEVVLAPYQSSLQWRLYGASSALHGPGGSLLPSPRRGSDSPSPRGESTQLAVFTIKIT